MLGSFEDIIATGTVQPGGGAVAVLYSETADIFFDGTGTYGAELRSLYIALKHLQLPVEVMIEGDCDATAGKLK